MQFINRTANKIFNALLTVDNKPTKHFLSGKLIFFENYDL